MHNNPDFTLGKNFFPSSATNQNLISTPQNLEQENTDKAALSPTLIKNSDHSTSEFASQPPHKISIFTKETKKNWRELMLAGKFNKTWTELMLATSSDDIDSVKDLISKGCNLDVQNDEGLTALMIAIMYKRPEIIKTLIDAGADLEIRDYYGKTALSIALSFVSRGKVRISRKSKKVASTKYKRLVLNLLFKGGCSMKGLTVIGSAGQILSYQEYLNIIGK